MATKLGGVLIYVEASARKRLSRQRLLVVFSNER